MLDAFSITSVIALNAVNIAAVIIITTILKTKLKNQNFVSGVT